jgi:hypothetical protein
MNQINIVEDSGLLRTGGILLLVLLAASAGWVLYKNTRDDEDSEAKPTSLIDVIKSFFTNTKKTTVETLTFRELIGWFVSNQDNYVKTDSVCGFSLSSRINGKYETIQGFFDKKTQKVLGGRIIASFGYDEELSARHKNNELVIYE